MSTLRDARMPGKLALLSALVGVGLTGGPASAQEQSVVITGSVTERLQAEAPYAIGVLTADQISSSGPMINLSESMARIPGLVVANRHNFAQDLQISSRGFGARAGFGVRGVRIYTDGIPASMPDGQGQVSHLDLAQAQRIEVLRGPFSVLYGNSSGGVIATITAPARQARAEVAFDAGSFGLRQWRLGAGAPISKELDIRASVASMDWGGFRPQSEAQKQTGHARLGWQTDRDRVVVMVGALNQPADDPLGLTQAQFSANPRQTTPQATQFDTRKNLHQSQLGAQWRHRYGGGSALADATVTAYVGERSVTQWLAIAAGTQAAPRHGGGVIDFDRSYSGLDARMTWRLGPTNIVTGVAHERQQDDRRGYLNYTGAVATPTYGVIGTLRRDEDNGATTSDAYVQAEIDLAPSVMATAGVRGGTVKLNANDNFLSNGNDSGARKFNFASPVLGLRWRAAPNLHLHASVGRGFESPTLGELAYQADGTGGFNTALSPQKSNQFEVGAKWRSSDQALAADVALFRVEVANEIGVATNAGGRQSFRNVGRTAREGLETSLAWRITPQWRAQTAITMLNATYRDGFLACAGIPCTAATVQVAAGNRIAGTQRGLAFAELAWQPLLGTEFGFETRAGSALTANDTNTESTARYTVFALRARHRIPLPEKFELELLARLDNITNKSYVGSVIVNDANGRYHEPAAPRSGLISLRLARTF